MGPQSRHKPRQAPMCRRPWMEHRPAPRGAPDAVLGPPVDVDLEQLERRLRAATEIGGKVWLRRCAVEIGAPTAHDTNAMIGSLLEAVRRDPAIAASIDQALSR